MKINLKLGESLDDMLKVPEQRERKHYPIFHITSDEKLELPHEGTMTIRFKKTGFAMREDDEGDLHYSCDVEVHEIIDAESDEPEAPARSRSKETEDALETGRVEILAKRKKSVDY